jgi:putative ABC transport system ATP-binding protein
MAGEGGYWAMNGDAITPSIGELDRRPRREIARLESVRKIYGRRGNPRVALDGVTVSFEQSTFTSVMGPSGSGKSTLLNMAAGLDRPTSGSVVLDGTDVSALSETALTKLRRERVGFVFQAFNLLPSLTVDQNITLPVRLAGRRPDRAHVTHVVDLIGMGERRTSRPAELSGGQQQRVAIGRALVSRPAIIFADEPTGALDTTTAHGVLSLLRDSVRQFGQTVVMVTHDPMAASFADRVVFLADGRFVGELRDPTADGVARRMTHLGAWTSLPEPPGRSSDA